MTRNDKTVHLNMSPAAARALTRLATAETQKLGANVSKTGVVAQALKKAYPQFGKIYEEEMAKDQDNDA